MLDTIGFAIIAMIAFGVNDLIFKRAASRGIAPHQIMLTSTIPMWLVFTVWGATSGSLVPHPAALWGAAAAAFGYFAFYNFSKVLQSGAVSIAVPVFRLFFVVTAVLAIVFLNEPLSGLKLAGLAAAVLAVWLLLASQRTRSAEISREAMTRILVAALVGGVPFLFFKLGLVHGATPASVVVAQSFVLSLISIGTAYYIDHGIKASGAALAHGVVFGLIQALGFGILVVSMVKGEASIVVPIGQLSFVVSALVGIAFLKEALTRRKVAGIVAAVTAVLLLALAARFA